MEAVTGVFRTSGDARLAIGRVRSLGLSRDKINLLTPSASLRALEHELGTVPTSDTEQPGMGTAMGAVLGGVAGVAAGPLGAAALAVALPGIGSIAAIGLYASAILGAGGAAAGAVAGHAVENSMTDGLPKDELFVYEDALRQGRTVLMVLAEDDDEADDVRDVLSESGAETVDAARKQWWIGLRNAEAEHYQAGGKSFDADEETYRRGFEAALHADARGKPFDDVLEYLRKNHPGLYEQQAFRLGFERGREHAERALQEPIETGGRFTR